MLHRGKVYSALCGDFLIDLITDHYFGEQLWEELRKAALVKAD
jgi:hypothetical protein